MFESGFSHRCFAKSRGPGEAPPAFPVGAGRSHGRAGIVQWLRNTNHRRTMADHISEWFQSRVSERAVARVLELLATEPHRRDVPHAGDRQGDFDYWFDGGACRVLTGSVEFELDDGTLVRSSAPMPHLALTIRFPDGRRVRVQQERS